MKCQPFGPHPKHQPFPMVCPYWNIAPQKDGFRSKG